METIATSTDPTPERLKARREVERYVRDGDTFVQAGSWAAGRSNSRRPSRSQAQRASTSADGQQRLSTTVRLRAADSDGCGRSYLAVTFSVASAWVSISSIQIDDDSLPSVPTTA